MRFRHFIHRAILKLGYDVRRVEPLRWQPGRAYWDPDYLRRLGFRPRTVIDVGVAFGTPQLYEAFPDAYFILIEPLTEFEPYLREILKTYRGEYFLTAVGARNGTEMINIESGWIERSSLHQRTQPEVTGDQLARREIPVTTLDALLERHRFQPPFGLKIDAEGGEFQVIEGASRLLWQTQFVIAEVPVAHRFESGYSFAEFIDLMDRNQFCLCDLLDIGRAENSEVTFIDAVFKRT